VDLITLSAGRIFKNYIQHKSEGEFVYTIILYVQHKSESEFVYTIIFIEVQTAVLALLKASTVNLLHAHQRSSSAALVLGNICA
jgi:hypothetical protein